jgi:hypothetical protein
MRVLIGMSAPVTACQNLWRSTAQRLAITDQGRGRFAWRW